MGVHIEKYDFVGDRQTDFHELEIPKPVEERFALLGIGELNGLMDHVACRIAVSQDDIAIVVEFFPLHAERRITVNGEKGRGRKSVDILGMAAKVPAQVHAHQH